MYQYITALICCLHKQHRDMLGIFNSKKWDHIIATYKILQNVWYTYGLLTVTVWGYVHGSLLLTFTQLILQFYGKGMPVIVIWKLLFDHFILIHLSLSVNFKLYKLCLVFLLNEFDMIRLPVLCVNHSCFIVLLRLQYLLHKCIIL